MAGAGAIRAGRAFVEFGGDDSKLNKILTSVEKRLKSWGSSISNIGKAVSAAGALIEAPMVAAAKLFASTGSEVHRLSEMTGISAESMLSFMGAATRAGIEIEDVTTGIKKMQKSIFDAALGSESARTALRHLGLSAAQLIGMRPEEQFRLIAERLAMIQNPAIRTGVALEIMGKSAANLIPLMLHLKELEARGKRSGPGLTAKDVEMAHELELSFLDLASAVKKFTLQIGAAVAPQIKKIVDIIVAVIAKSSQWIKDNRALILTIFQISGIVVIAGAAIALLGAGITALATVIASIVVIIGALGAAFAFLISPLGLILLGLTAITVAFFTLTDTGAKAIQFLVDAFWNFADESLKAFNGVRDALSSGDIALAFKVLGTWLSLQWAKVIAFLSVKWAEFLNFILPTAIDIAKRIAAIFIDMGVSIAQTFLRVSSAIVATLKTLNVDIEDFMAKLDIAFAADRGELTKKQAEDNWKRIDDANKKRKAKIAADARAGPAAADALAFFGIAAKGAAGAAIDAAGTKVIAGADANAKAALDDVDKARADFNDAVDKAAKGRKEFKPGESPFGLPAGIGDFGQAKAAVTGTFSATAAAGLSGSSQLGQVADNTADMKKSLKVIAAKQPGIGVM